MIDAAPLILRRKAVGGEDIGTENGARNSSRSFNTEHIIAWHALGALLPFPDRRLGQPAHAGQGGLPTGNLDRFFQSLVGGQVRVHT